MTARRTLIQQAAGAPPVTGKNIVANRASIGDGQIPVIIDGQIWINGGYKSTPYTTELVAYDTDLVPVKANRYGATSSKWLYGRGNCVKAGSRYFVCDIEYDSATTDGGPYIQEINADLSIVANSTVRGISPGASGKTLTCNAVTDGTHIYIASPDSVTRKYIIEKFDLNLNVVASISSAMVASDTSEVYYGIEFDGSGFLHIAMGVSGYNVGFEKYDTNLNLISQAICTMPMPAWKSSYETLTYANGYLYAGITIQNEDSRYDMGLIRIDTGYTGWDLRRLRASASMDFSLQTFGSAVTDNGNVYVIGTSRTATGQAVTVLEFSPSLVLTGQIQDQNEAVPQLGGVVNLGNSLYMSFQAQFNGGMHLVRFDSIDFPTPTTAPCSNIFSWLNTSYTTSVESGVPTVTAPAAGASPLTTTAETFFAVPPAGSQTYNCEF